MSNLVPFKGNMAPAVFSQFGALPDLNASAQAGIQPSFATISFKGKVWSIKYRGEVDMVPDARGNPAPNLDVIIVGINPAISKQYYEKKFSEGDVEAPDCFSVDGIAPDPASPHKQNAACATCPKNVWGSRITESGKKAKACMDTRRIAVVPAGDVRNETYGGPMMLRLPATSLATLDAFSRECARFNAQPFQVITALGFDHTLAYPQITFKPLGWVSDPEQAATIYDLVTKDDRVQRMLQAQVVEAKHDVEDPSLSPLAVGAPALVAPVPVAEPVAAVVPVAAPTPVVQAPARSPFVAATQPVVAAPPATPVAAAEVIQTTEEKIEAAVVVQAPADMEAELDALLAS